jgi:hypothetical protein
MFSLDRNFVFGDKKHPANSSQINRSQSFNIAAIPSSNNWWERSSEKEHYYHIIPRVKNFLDEEQKSYDTVPSLDEPTPDYDEEIIIRHINNDTDDDVGEEPIADYDDSKPISTSEYEEKSMTPPSLYDLGVSSSFIIPQTSITPSSETYTQEQTYIPPTPPPLPISVMEQKKTTFRCRTIADKITADHKLILKDELETITNTIKEKQSGNNTISVRKYLKAFLTWEVGQLINRFESGLCGSCRCYEYAEKSSGRYHQDTVFASTIPWSLSRTPEKLRFECRLETLYKDRPQRE